MLSALRNLFSSQISRNVLCKSKMALRKSECCRCHSTYNLPSATVHILPALQDNYMYVMVDTLTKSALAVDPVEPTKVLNLIYEEKANLLAVLTTHHHLDHCGGNTTLLDLIGKELPVYGGDDRIASLNRKVSHEDTFTLDRFFIKSLFTPCHTSGHMCYFVQNGDSSSDPVCFTGDTLFVAGCGRFFEGSAENMLSSLEVLQSLPSNTKVFCGHEYTVSNLKFASHVEPNNKATADKLAWALERRSKHKPTVPSSIGEEQLYNPFMRVSEESVQSFAKESDAVAVMQVLRKCKDVFKA